MKKVVFIVLSVVLTLAMLLAGCSSKSTQESVAGDGDYYSEAEYPAEEAPQASVDAGQEENGGAGGSIDYEESILQPVEARKIIYRGTIEAQTTEFDQDYNKINAKLNEFGGYVESSSVSGTKPEEWQDTGRYAQMTLRVPSDKFDEFMVFLGQMGETISSSVSGEDISLQYFDTETKLQTLRTREDRLEALLEKAATMEDIISLEQALSDVSYEIQSLEMNLRDFDSLIDYSTVTIYLTEVNVIDEVTPSSPKTLGERISSGFYSVLNVLADIGEGLLIFLLAGSPVLVPIVVILVLVIVLTRRSKRKRAQNAVGNMNAPRGTGANYDPKTGHPYYNANHIAPDAGQREGKQNDDSNKDSKNDQ